MKYALKFASLLLFVVFNSFAQTSENDALIKLLKDTYFVTWNKNTPEQQMKDDVKAFAEKGVILKYNKVKRNDKNEIIAITISYETKIGEKGALSYDNIKPIAEIKIYKLNNEIGFGEAPNSSAGLVFSSSVNQEDALMKNYNFTYPNEKPSGPRTLKSIQRTGKQPLLIENGKVIEGGSDYTSEELNEILKSSESNDIYRKRELKSFNFKGNQDFSEEIRIMQEQLDALKERQNSTESKEKEKAIKEEGEKTKSTSKVKKA
jgi:hypothetical protein